MHALLAGWESHSPYFAGHSTRVARIARMLAEGMGLPRRATERTVGAAAVAGLGMLWLPDRLINKRSRLATAELQEVRRHPERGARILEADSVLRPLAPLVYHHHERYDGRGYPTGKRGEDIPVGAAVVAVAETYDALMGERPYRQRLTPDAALAVMRAGSGTQFHPEVVRALTHLKTSATPREALPLPAGQSLTAAFAPQKVTSERGRRIHERVARAIELVGELKPFVSEVAAILSEEMDVPIAVVRLLDPATGDLILEGAVGVAAASRPQAFPAGRGLLGWVLEHRQPVVIADAHNDPRSFAPFPELRSLLAVPLLHAGEAVGVMAVGSNLVGVFGPGDLLELTVVSDVVAATTAVARLHQELRHAATQDSLTGTASRWEVFRQLERLLAEARQGQRLLAVILVDMNGLKEINDRFGHLAGDEALRRMVQALRCSLRTSDVVGRYGGDEFLILLPGVGREEAETVMMRMKAPSDAVGPHPTWCFGVAAYPDDGETSTALIAVADTRLYQQKRHS